VKINSREEILNKIAAIRSKRVAAIDIQPSDNEEIYKPIFPDSVTCFINELKAINGQCIVCENESDLYSKLNELVQSKHFPYLFCRDSYIAKQLKTNNIAFSNNISDFENMQAGITGCEFLVARTGSVIVTSATESGRQMNVFPPVHIVLAHVSQLIDYPAEAYKCLLEKYGTELPSTISTITGPSRTADIEKTLVLGAHGPKEFIVFLSKT
jgi:L-lactate dehydrogenase complex protein LldG